MHLESLESFRRKCPKVGSGLEKKPQAKAKQCEYCVFIVASSGSGPRGGKISKLSKGGFMI